MAEFLQVITPDEFVRRLSRFSRLPIERLPLEAALHRHVAADVVSTEDLPPQPRSTVDGFAVRAEDTFGATDALPALVQVVGTVEMGTVPAAVIHAGQAAQIPTGGYLPEGADSVVMIEYTNHTGAGSIEVTRPVTAGANVLEKGEDVRAGEVVIPKGLGLRPQDIGLMAALGIGSAPVYRRARVAVISTGDEIVPVGRAPMPGQVRDANSYSIRALAAAAGSEPVSFDIIPDVAARLGEALERSLEQADLAVISGGSSVGVRDLMVDVVSGLSGAQVLAHGVAIRPGKPTMLAERGGKAILGLPGHPVSAMIVALVFLQPFLRYLQGAELTKGPVAASVAAELSTSIHSVSGLEEYVRVALRRRTDGAFVADPVFGKSGVLSTMVKSDGIVVVPMNAEGYSRGEIVEVARW